MSLKRLELTGFKSFMNPICLDFKDGVTAILGPNGCGKTNIVDAVRWVLGEQSARQLRSSKMENVIFNGTQLHKPLGQAVVNLTVSNERGRFPLDYSEITITRKVYRSGISEYFINKNPCRLKDIKSLFADTGTGSHSYSVIEQEMMDYVLNDAHGERKQMFEEAAGIVKYRIRREEAKRKLKLTEQDLVRLDDILEELGKQARSLRYQVGKTKRYRRLKDRIREWELILLRKRLSGFLSEKRVEEKRLHELEKISGEGNVSTSGMENEIESMRLDLVELEKKRGSLQNGRYDLRKKIQSVEEKIIQLSERRAENERRIERNEKETEEAKGRIGGIAERISSVSLEIGNVSRRIEAKKEEKLARQEDYEKLAEETEDAKSRLIGLKQTQLDFIQDQARLSNEIEHSEGVLARMDGQIREAREEVLRLDSENGRIMGEKEGLQTQVDRLKEELRKNREARLSLLEKKREIENIIPEAEAQLSDRKESLTRNMSRCELYRKMLEEFEGFPTGAKYLLKKGSGHILGPVAELLEVDRKYGPALEAVLGGMLDGIVVDSMEGALRLAGELEREGKGGARFLVRSSAEAPGGEIEEAPGLLGRLESFVKFKGDLRGLGRDLFNRVLLFVNTETAVDFMTSNPESGCGAVSTSGVYISGEGEVYFHGGGKDEIPMLDRSGMVRKMEEKIAGLKKEVDTLDGKREGLRSESARLQAEIEDLENHFEEAESGLSGKREELQNKEREQIVFKEKHSLLLQSLGELENSRKDTLSHLEASKLTLQMQQGSEEVTEISSLESRVTELQPLKEELESVINELKIDIASLKGSLEKREEEIRGLGEMEKQFKDLVGQRSEEIYGSLERIAKIAEVLDRERESVKELLEEERGFQTEIDLLNDRIEKKRDDIGKLEAVLRERKKERDELVARENEIKISISSLETKINDSVDMAGELYNEDYQCYLEGIEVPLSEEETTVTQQRLEEVKDKLERIGAVNLAAVEEYDEKKERLEFLNGQKDDLVNAKEELEEAILRINRKARRMFKETFEQVSQYFSQIFEVLFEGGEANLSLCESTDPLEANINIAARPKGKRLQDISLLSGGERALTSLALLFALYKAKPSPFCILDEVDAPLDDANIRRFVRMVRRFSTETQFIIITHNKGTMEMADSLLGVTMQEKGVSTVVSVDMEKVDSVLASGKKAKREEIKEPTLSRN